MPRIFNNTYIEENDIRIEFPGALRIIDFDSVKDNMNVTCWKSVDFIVQTPNEIMFVEIKDFDDPMAKPVANINTTKQKIVDNVSGKYRDTYLYNIAENILPKPYKFYFLLLWSNLPASIKLYDDIKRNIPVGNLNGNWTYPLLNQGDFALFDAQRWNKRFPNYHITRLSSNTVL